MEPTTTPEQLEHLLNHRIEYKDWKPIIEYKEENARVICFEFVPFNMTNVVRTKWEYINLMWDEDKIIKRVLKLIKDAEEYELHYNFKFDGSLILAHDVPFEHLAKLAPKQRTKTDIDF